jgi:serine/threonine protein kinase
MSPERTQGIDTVDGRSDLYSLGALVYALLTGRPPFLGETLADTVVKIRHAEPDPPKKYQMAVPDALQGIVLQLLAKRPENRYPTATQLLKDLERTGRYLRITVGSPS